MSFTVALISDVFFDRDPYARLLVRLREARSRGATLAVLPELACNPWSPATTTARDDDAEPAGPTKLSPARRGNAEPATRWAMQQMAAAEAGIALVGGAIIRSGSGRRAVRRNTAIVFDADGSVLGTYAKCHLPEEPGFWETSHYVPGDKVSPVFRMKAGPAAPDAMPFGVQICSDINRPEGCHMLAAHGATLVVAPRATELATYERWKVVFRANALTSCMYVLSVNRPGPEQGVLIGGPSIAVGPDGRVLLETTDPVGVVTLDPAAIDRNRVAYPGYLPVRSALYAAGWTAAMRATKRPGARKAASRAKPTRKPAARAAKGRATKASGSTRSRVRAKRR